MESNSQGMNSELHFKIRVEPLLRSVVAAVVSDAESVGITKEDVMRVVFMVAMEEMSTQNPPGWLMSYLDSK